MRFFILSLFILLAASSVCFAQRNPTMTSQLDDADREQLYARFSENKKVPVAERQKLAYEAARDYVKRYSSEQDSHLAEMRRFVQEYERAMGNFEIHEAFSAGKIAKAFELGRELLKKNPENFYVLTTLVQAGYINALKGDPTFVQESIDAAQRAIAIAESDKFTHADPFSTVADARGFLNFALGTFEISLAPEKASAALVQAVKSGSSYKDNPLTYNLLGISILKGEYAQVSAEYNAKFGNKPPSPEQEAMLKRIIQLGERAIDAYARSVALSTKPEQQEARTKMLGQLTQLYKNFHNGSDAGLTELIAGVLSKPLPE
jgi:hypothetical protein